MYEGPKLHIIPSFPVFKDSPLQVEVRRKCLHFNNNKNTLANTSKMVFKEWCPLSSARFSGIAKVCLKDEAPGLPDIKGVGVTALAPLEAALLPSVHRVAAATVSSTRAVGNGVELTYSAAHRSACCRWSPIRGKLNVQTFEG